MRTMFFSSFFLVVILFPGIAFAAPAGAPLPEISSPETLEDLANVMAKIQLREAQLRLLSLEARIRDLENGGKTPVSEQDIVVLSIVAKNGRPYAARIRMAGYEEREVPVGADLGGGRIVLEVRENGLVIGYPTGTRFSPARNRGEGQK